MTGLSKAIAGVLLLVLPAAASATVYWRVNGVFSDGTLLSGTFAINQYGFLSAASLTTEANAPFTGFTYAPGNSSESNGATYVDFQPSFQSDLHLVLANDLSHASVNPIAAGSYECQASFNCYNATGGHTRYLTSGTATVPEPASWALLGAGFAAVGGAARRLRRAAARAA